MIVAALDALFDDALERTGDRSLHRQITIRPGMCGPNALLVGQIGDWTWDTVSRLCGVNAFRAVDEADHPTYLSFYYYHVIGDRDFHLLTPTFGDRLQVVSTCYGLGSESVLTLHRLTHAARELPPTLSAEEVATGRIPGCLYVQNVNRWIQRGANGNRSLHTAAPVGFRHTHLEQIPAALSPRLAYDTARRAGAFPSEGNARPEGEWTLPYEVDPSRDLNGVGLLCFASYFSIADGALWKVWRLLGRDCRAFLGRIGSATRVCFLGNAEAGARLSVEVRRWISGAARASERFDVLIVEEDTRRMLAVAAFDFEYEENGR